MNLFEAFLSDRTQFVFGAQYYVARTDFVHVWKTWVSNRRLSFSVIDVTGLLQKYGLSVVKDVKRDPLQSDLPLVNTTWIVGCTVADFLSEMKRIVAQEASAVVLTGPVRDNNDVVINRTTTCKC